MRERCFTKSLNYWLVSTSLQQRNWFLAFENLKNGLVDKPPVFINVDEFTKDCFKLWEELQMMLHLQQIPDENINLKNVVESLAPTESTTLH